MTQQPTAENLLAALGATSDAIHAAAEADRKVRALVGRTLAARIEEESQFYTVEKDELVGFILGAGLLLDSIVRLSPPGGEDLSLLPLAYGLISSLIPHGFDRDVDRVTSVWAHEFQVLVSGEQSDFRFRAIADEYFLNAVMAGE